MGGRHDPRGPRRGLGAPRRADRLPRRALPRLPQGRPGWLEGDASIVEGQGTPRALFRSGDVEVELALDARADEATVAGFRHDLQAWNVLLVSGLGEPDRGPSVRTLSRLPARTAPDANPAQQLYDGSVELRASIHYTR